MHAQPGQPGQGVRRRPDLPLRTGGVRQAALTAADPFFGGQVPIDIFGPAAKAIPVAYEAPFDDAVAAPFPTSSTKSSPRARPRRGLGGRGSEGKQIAKRQGVS